MAGDPIRSGCVVLEASNTDLDAVMNMAEPKKKKAENANTDGWKKKLDMRQMEGRLLWTSVVRCVVGLLYRAV